MLVDFRGHFKRKDKVALAEIEDRYIKHNLEEALTFRTLTQGFMTERGIDLPDTDSAYTGMSCSQCGKGVSVDISNTEIISKTACAYPDGVEPYVVKIPVPSGKLAVGNDFRRFVPSGFVESEESISSLAGKKAFTVKFASVGVLCVSVGNSCPDVYQDGNKVWFGHNFPEEQKVGNVTTDLWCVSAMDESLMMARASDKEIPCDESYFIVNVEPGDYEFTHFLIDWDEHEQPLWCSGKKIGL